MKAQTTKLYVGSNVSVPCCVIQLVYIIVDDIYAHKINQNVHSYLMKISILFRNKTENSVNKREIKMPFQFYHRENLLIFPAYK